MPIQDNFTYGYYANSNKLRQTASAQGNNYEYDAIGNLTKDVAGGVTNIEWTPSGKVRKVTKSTGSPIEFRYDAAGNRVEKKQGTAITRYIRDASGNVMAVYQADTLSERPIYGSSRLGNLSYASKPGYRTVGHKQYELSNHLGNVLAVVSDRIRMKTDSTWTQVISRTDYYPFGLEMTGRTESATYRYGFNGKEKDPSGQWSNQSHYDYGFRIYNPTIGKFLSVDPLAKSYPWYTPYQFAGNNPIKFIDLDGLEEYDPQQDAFFTARLLLTTFYDIKHSAENLILNTFVPADPGMKWQASYKINNKGDEIFETVIRQIPQQGAVMESVNTALDIVNIAFAGKLDPTDFVSVRTGGNTQLTRGIRNFLEDIDNLSFKNSFQDGEYLIGTTNVDITVFQVHNIGKEGGSFFTTVKPRNAIQAEDMLNIRMYDNFAEEITSYTIKKGTEFSYGKVSGGSGDQIFIPRHLQKSDHIIKGKTEPLPIN